MLKQNQAKFSEEQSPNPGEDSSIAGTIVWQPTSNIATWDQGALNAMGLSSDLEQNIYRNMDITDRIHLSDETELRECLLHAQDDAFTIEVKLKHKNKSYQIFQIERGDILDNGDIPLLLTLLNGVG